MIFSWRQASESQFWCQNIGNGTTTEAAEWAGDAEQGLPCPSQDVTQSEQDISSYEYCKPWKYQPSPVHQSQIWRCQSQQRKLEGMEPKHDWLDFLGKQENQGNSLVRVWHHRVHQYNLKQPPGKSMNLKSLISSFWSLWVQLTA